MFRNRLFFRTISLLVVLLMVSSSTSLSSRAEVQATLVGSAPALVGQVGGASFGVAYRNGYIYLGLGPRLYVYYAINLSNPVLVAVSDILPDIIQDVKTVYGRAYVTLGEGGLAIINILTPSAPVIMGIYDTPGFARGLWIENNYAYVADGATGIVVLNVSNPYEILEVAIFPTFDNARDVLISDAGSVGNKLFIADGSGGLLALKVQTGELVDSEPTEGYAEALTVLAPYIYVAGGEAGLQLYKISSNDTFFPMLCINDTPGYAQDVTIYNTYIYVADGAGGMRVFNRDWESLTAKGNFDSPGYASGLDLLILDEKPYVFLADYSGMSVVMAEDQMFPTALSITKNPAVPARLAVSGDYAYIADHLQGLRIFNTSNAAQPILNGTIDTLGISYDVAVSENAAYLADGKAGLQILDVSDPGAPVHTGNVDTAGNAVAVAVDGNLAYLADSDNGLVGVAMTQTIMGTLTVSYTFDTQGIALDVALAEDYAYVADGENGLVIVNRFPLDSMTQAGWIDTSSANAVTVQGDYAYVADGFAGLRIIDIADPSLPAQAGFYDTPGKAVDVVVAGKRAYIAEENSGVRVVDVSDPARPVFVFFYPTFGEASGIAVTDAYLYVADEQGGLLVYELPPETYTLMLPLVMR